MYVDIMYRLELNQVIQALPITITIMHSGIIESEIKISGSRFTIDCLRAIVN